MNTLTDAFDLGLQLREDALNRIFRAMHVSGSVDHYYVRAFGQRRVELQIGSPHIVLLTAPTTDGKMRAVAQARVLYHSRSLADAGEVGTSAVADVTVRVKTELSTGDPATLGAGAALIVDWRETTSADIVVYGASPAFETEVKGAILDFVKSENGGEFTLPPIGAAARTVGSAAFRFLDSGSALGRLLAVGMNLGTTVKGSKAGMQQAYVQQDWALALSADFILGEIRNALQQQFSQLPPPFGTNPVTISDQVVCTIELPYVGCVDHARQRIFLDRLDISLQPGSIKFSGQVREHTDAWYVPDLSATWTATVTLGIGAGNTITLSASQPTVQLNEWYGQVGNFFSGNALQTLVGNGVRSALQSGVQQGEFSQLVSAETLKRLASLGGSAALTVSPRPTSVEVRPEAVIVHGTIDAGQTSAAPSAAFASLTSTGAPLKQILHAGTSWAPGGRIVQYDWDFGDGHTDVTSGTSTRYVTDHVYSPGTYRACVTVHDDSGRTATQCRSLAPGVLSLRRVRQQDDRAEWELCELSAPFAATFVALTGEEPMGGVFVTVSGNGWQRSDWTGTDGRVTFQFDPKEFQSGVVVKHPPGFGVGMVRVEAARSGYVSAQHDLWMVDCGAIAEIVIKAREHVQQIIDRLIGLEALKQLRETGFGISLDLDKDPRDDPRARVVLELGHALEVTKEIVQLLELDSTVLPVGQLLGIEERGPELAGAVARRLDGVLDGMTRALDELEGSGPGPDRRDIPR